MAALVLLIFSFFSFFTLCVVLEFVSYVCSYVDRVPLVFFLSHITGEHSRNARLSFYASYVVRHRVEGGMRVDGTECAGDTASGSYEVVDFLCGGIRRFAP